MKPNVTGNIHIQQTNGGEVHQGIPLQGLSTNMPTSGMYALTPIGPNNPQKLGQHTVGDWLSQNPAMQRMALQRVALSIEDYASEIEGIQSSTTKTPKVKLFGGACSSGDMTRVPSQNDIKDHYQEEENDVIRVDDMTNLQPPTVPLPTNHLLTPSPLSKHFEQEERQSSTMTANDEQATAEAEAAANRYVLLPGGMFAKPKDVFVESLPGGQGRQMGGCLVVSLYNLLIRYDALDKHYYKLKNENAQLRNLLFELYETLPQVHPKHCTHANALRQELGASILEPEINSSPVEVIKSTKTREVKSTSTSSCSEEVLPKKLDKLKRPRQITRIRRPSKQ